jgi:hypothetical protein
MNEIENLEAKSTEDRLKLLLEKRASVQKACDLEGEAGREFAYKKQLSDLDVQIDGLKKQLAPGIQRVPAAAAIPWSDFFHDHALRDDLPPSVAVNCNREEHYAQGLLEHFRTTMRSNRNRLYCIVACPYQRPASIAKRLVYEIIEKRLQIAFISDDARPQEVEVVELKFGFDSEHTWALNWDDVKTRIAPKAAGADSPADVANQCGGKQFIALLFRITAQEWNRNSIEHLQHLVSQFDGLPENSRKYLVVLALEFPHIHSRHYETYQADLEQIKELCQKASSDSLFTACFDLLPPVQHHSIEKWSSDVLQKDKEAGFKRLLQQLRIQAGAEEGLLPVDFSMEVVETMQEAAWAHRNRPRPDLPF